MAEQERLTSAQIASKAQAEAHRRLREAHPDEARGYYQEAKARLEAGQPEE